MKIPHSIRNCMQLILQRLELEAPTQQKTKKIL